MKEQDATKGVTVPEKEEKEEKKDTEVTVAPVEQPKVELFPQELGSTPTATSVSVVTPQVAEVPPQVETKIFVVKTTVNQERAVANMLEKTARRQKFDIRSILVPGELKGYVLVECPLREIIEEAIQGIHHARSLVKGDTSLDKVVHFLTPKPLVTGISAGAIVELIAGPFKGEKARVKRVDETHEEITIELFDAIVPIPVTVRGDHVRVLSKEEAEK